MSQLAIPSLDKEDEESKVYPVYVAAILEVNDTRHAVQAMVDSGATGNFVDRTLLKGLNIPTQTKRWPELVHAEIGRAHV